MSYGSGYTGQGPPPLPPRSWSTVSGDRDQHAAEDPPPLPPRPPGFGYQPVRLANHTYLRSDPLYYQQNGTGSSQPPESPISPGSAGPSQSGHTTSYQPPSVLDEHQDPTSQHVGYNGSHNTPDISQHFPTGIIPPPPPGPPPRQGQGPRVHSPSYHGERSPNIQQSRAPSTQHQPTQYHAPEYSTQSKDDSTGSSDSAQHAQTPDENTQEPSTTAQENDIPHLNEQLRQIHISRIVDDVRSSSARPASGPATTEPARSSPASLIDTSQASSPYVATAQAPNVAPRATPRDPDAFTECSDAVVSFKAKWYSHPASPNYTICSYCYEEYIRGSAFRGQFEGTIFDDGKPRICRFSKPRMKDSLTKAALATGSLDPVVEYMVLRTSITDCPGQNWVNGTAGIRWYRPKNSAIPGMVVCQACYEDRVLVHQDFATNFEPTPAQPADQAWSCDMAVPHISREFDVRAKEYDWAAFIREASARLKLPACPKEKGIPPDGRAWYTPVSGPRGFLICAACWCDYIAHTGQASKWQRAGTDLQKLFRSSIECCFGRFNRHSLAARTIDTGDWDLFWKGADAIAREPTCDGNGMPKETNWYTLRSNPHSFAVCGECHATIVATHGVADLFVPKRDVPPSSTLVCTFNPAMPRFALYLNKFVEMVLTRDPGPLECFANEYAYIPLCRGSTFLENARWFGWPECTICPSCYHDFVRGTALADAVPLKGVQIAKGRMCEMYSPRMRGIYLEACRTSPPDPTLLLVASEQRRYVWAETIPVAKRLEDEQHIKIYQQNDLQRQSMFYTFLGNSHQSVVQSPWVYDVPGLGSGFHNGWQETGAQKRREADQAYSQLNISSTYTQIGMLRTRWRQVE